MKFENTEVWGFEHAIRGMRNPKESWAKSDSHYCSGVCDDCDDCREGNKYQAGPLVFTIGPADLKLMQTLIKSGPEHRKFMRQIFVSVDITAPLYWFKEFDTYKIGTVENSTSTMHTIKNKVIDESCFEMDDFEDSLIILDSGNLRPQANQFLKSTIQYCEVLRKTFVETGDKKVWKELIRLLPESWLQTRTVTMNYENLLAMCSKGQRRFHKLNEWSGQDNDTLPNFIDWARTLPYAQELLFLDELDTAKE